ncbi:MAG: tetratricopeptide repeat protein [Bacteroidetes bacterium]|nr:MAG: tetratricopeptide repeat protein [Bacteroidota bacterium]
MKLLLLCTGLLCLHLAKAQEWKDSLQEARKLYQSGSYEQALQKYQSTKKIAPKGIDLSDEIGQTAYRARKFEEAGASYEQSSSKKGTAKDRARTYHNIGNTKYRQKRYDEAIQAYKQALREDPSDDETRYNLALAQRQKRAQQKNPQNQEGNKNQNQGNKNQKEQKKNSRNQEGSDQNKSERNQDAKNALRDKGTERALDELVKKEMETKKKLGGYKSKTGSSKSGKDW